MPPVSDKSPHSNMVQTQYQLATPATQSGRLKYANPRDLPSFPSHGLRQDGAAAGAAASLGWANQKSIQTWTPGKSASASTAAMLAKDYKAAPSWEPNSSSAGAKAALLATASTRKPTAPPVPQDTWGSSAANQAFKSSRSVRHPPNTTATKESLGSLSAAKDAMATSRPRSKSSPIVKESYPGESRAAANALSAATIAHGPSMQSKNWSGDAGAVPYTTLPRSMFTSHPPVAPEVNEQKRADVLHASAVAMAKKMYSQQQKILEATKEAHKGLSSESLDDASPSPYINLQEAAYKLAQERLSKLHDEHQQNREYQQYYGGTSNTPHRRFSMRGKLRRRASSDGDIMDKKQSERIRQQMSIFSTNLTKVDEQKRTKDREALMAVAQRNVKARLQGMDEKVSADSAKITPSRLSEWEFKAHAAAQARHESRIGTENRGKLDVGGGMFMDQSEVDAIAAKRVQPLLDEINEKAAIERERLEVLKIETEAKKQDAEKQKSRDREIKEINRKYRDLEKQEEKEKRQHEKEEQKVKKEEGKAAKAEEKRLVKEEKRKSKDTKQPGTLAAGRLDSPDTSDSDENEPVAVAVAPVPQLKPTINTDTEQGVGESQRSPNESGSPTSKMKSWLKSRFSRPRSKSDNTDEDSGKQKGFIGGAALKGIGANGSTPSLDNRSSSMRDVALAGKNPEQTQDKDKTTRHSRTVSLASSNSELETFEEASDQMVRTITPPAPIRDPVAKKSSSPSRDSRFLEII